jgi:uncharacterized protein YgbK (DUF1537 family)
LTRQQSEVTRLVNIAVTAIKHGVSPLVFSAEGPDDPAVQSFGELATSAKLSRSDASELVGGALAEVMHQVLDQTRISRIVVAGGDSSGRVAAHLGISALTVSAGLVPGVPLCRAWSDDPLRDGLEVVLKGGQLGGANFYGLVRG